MDPNLEQRLLAIEKKLDENAVILKKMRSSQRMATFTKLLYWGILIGLGIVSISFIKPYLSQLGEAYGLGGTTTTSSYSDLLNDIK